MTPFAGQPECPALQAIEAWLDDPDATPDVDRHIQGCDACRRTVTDLRANLEIMTRLSRPGLSLKTEAATPKSIDDYDIIDEIHRGAQGIVYRATQRTTSRTVALKLLLAGTFATSNQRHRFEREIEIVAALDHPNIVTVFDSGRTEDDRLWLAMQYIPGRPLNEWLANAAEDQCTIDAIVRMGIAICDGVAHAHQHGVIHRDLKPANIIIDSSNQPRIVDFGLARPVTPSVHDQATVPGGFLGTLAYASPQQTRGETVDTRSDVYSLGVILFEMLTHRLPYDRSDDPVEMIRAIREDPPAPLRGRSAVTARPVSVDLQTIIVCALAKDPERRYASATALRNDLRRLLNGEPIDARSDSNWYLLRATLRRHRIAVTVASVFVLILIGFSITVAAMYGRLSTEVEKLNQINLFLEDTLGSVEPTRPGDDVTVRQLLDEAVHWIDIALSDQPEVAASIRTTVAGSYRSLGDLDTAETHARHALETRVAQLGPNHLDVAESHSLLGIIQRAHGDYEEAEASFIQALGIRRRHHGDGHLDVALTLANLGLVHRDAGAFDEAERFLQESLEIRRALRGADHADVAMCLFNLATVYEMRGDFTFALQRHEQALAMRRRVLHHDHPDIPRSLIEIVRLRLAGGHAAEAVPLAREGLAIRRRILAAEHWQIGEAMGLLGICLARAGESEEAGPILADAYEHLRVSLGDDASLTRDVARLKESADADRP